jgi:hypothetical protein
MQSDSPGGAGDKQYASVHEAFIVADEENPLALRTTFDIIASSKATYCR